MEFILDRVRVTKGLFTISCSSRPSAVYVASRRTSIEGDTRSSFIEVPFKHTGSTLSVSIDRDGTADIQMYDKVRFIISADGDFTLATPSFDGYDGVKKTAPDWQSVYHCRRIGKEMLVKTSVEDGWSVSGTASVRELPAEIANYSSFNSSKKHIELKQDGDTMKKTVDLSAARKVAVRVCANLFPKIATSRTFAGMTDNDKEEYISNVPTIVERGYNYGTLTISAGTGIYKEFTMHPGWMEYYFEMDVDALDKNVEIIVGRQLTEEGFTTNSGFKVFIQGVSIQEIS